MRLRLVAREEVVPERIRGGWRVRCARPRRRGGSRRSRSWDGDWSRRRRSGRGGRRDAERSETARAQLGHCRRLGRQRRRGRRWRRWRRFDEEHPRLGHARREDARGGHCGDGRCSALPNEVDEVQHRPPSSRTPEVLLVDKNEGRILAEQRASDLLGRARVEVRLGEQRWRARREARDGGALGAACAADI